MPRVVVPIGGWSDGDHSHRPTPTENRFSLGAPEVYLEKLAMKYMQETGGAVRGNTYVFQNLPAGYEVWLKTRLNHSTHVDRYLFGHPSHATFDSPNKFYPHLRYLIDYQPGNTCSCTLCAKSPSGPPTLSTAPATMSAVPATTSAVPATASAVPATMSAGPSTTSAGPSTMPAAPAAPHSQDEPTDAEGTPNFLTKFLTALKRDIQRDEFVHEYMSMDWRANRSLIEEMVENMKYKHAFIPRLGELVLWCAEVKGEIRRDPKDGHIKFYNPATGEYGGYPKWMGGVVTQVAEEPVVYEDLIRETKKQYSVNRSGFRVECMPDPNATGDGKMWSKNYKYVPLHHIRPFNFWKEFTEGISQDDWHPTIFHCLTAMGVWSTNERYRLRGTWPSATMFCKGIFIGAESIFPGDALKLKPRVDRNHIVSDVIVMDYAAVKFANFVPEADGVTVTGNKCFRIRCVISGTTFTLDPQNSFENESLGCLSETETGVAKGMDGWEKWYHMSAPDHRIEVNHNLVIGRAYERKAMEAWFGKPEAPKEQRGLGTMQDGYLGTMHARAFAAETDNRLVESGRKWYWADYRIDALNLRFMNGFEVGKWDTTRDPATWRNTLMVIDGAQDEAGNVVPKPGVLEAALEEAEAIAAEEAAEAEAEWEDVEEEDEEEGGTEGEEGLGEEEGSGEEGSGEEEEGSGDEEESGEEEGSAGGEEGIVEGGDEGMGGDGEAAVENGAEVGMEGMSLSE